MKNHSNRSGRYLFFMWQFFKNLKDVGSIVPDSRACRAQFLDTIPFHSARLILEYGSASGLLTRQLLRRKRPECRIIGFEKNPFFCRRLREALKSEDFRLIEGDVLDWRKTLLRDAGVEPGTVDCIVSTLPCSSLDFNALLEHSVLPFLREEGGVYVQYMHVISYLKGFSLYRELNKHFLTIRRETVFRNLPPTQVCSCHGVKHRERIPSLG